MLVEEYGTTPVDGWVQEIGDSRLQEPHTRGSTRYEARLGEVRNSSNEIRDWRYDTRAVELLEVAIT